MLLELTWINPVVWKSYLKDKSTGYYLIHLKATINFKDKVIYLYALIFTSNNVMKQMTEVYGALIQVMSFRPVDNLFCFETVKSNDKMK